MIASQRILRPLVCRARKWTRQRPEPPASRRDLGALWGLLTNDTSPFSGLAALYSFLTLVTEDT